MFCHLGVGKNFLKTSWMGYTSTGTCMCAQRLQTHKEKNKINWISYKLKLLSLEKYKKMNMQNIQWKIILGRGDGERN
jgi:hypothetical protein